MGEPWITTFSVVLVGLGALVELKLLRLLLREARAGGREGPARAIRSRPNRGEPETKPAPSRMARARLAGFVMAPALACSVAHGQDSATAGQAGAAAAETPPSASVEEPTKSAYSLQLNLDYTTAYFYHGIIQEDSGLILQPAAKLTVNLHEQGDFKIDGYLGTWNSFHSQKTNAQTQGDFTEYWYESDLLGGIAITMGKFSLATQYVFLTSPSDAYETVQELDFTLSFDDSELLGKFALRPYALLAIETGADASDGANSPTGTYLELGVGPGFSFDAGKTPVTITFPASVGLSLHDYYQNAEGENDVFGFFQIGAKASIPLPFAERFGKWTLNAGIYGIFLGDNTTEYNGGTGEQAIATLGLQLNF